MASDVDVTGETMGGTDEARQLVLASLKQKKPVVTANKNLLATHGDELFALATSRTYPLVLKRAWPAASRFCE